MRRDSMPPMVTQRPFRTRFTRLLRQVVGPAAGVLVVVYFAYHTVQGDRGWLAYLRLQGEVAEAEMILDHLRQERQAMERRAKLLHPETLDRDLLEEQARALLNYSHPDDLVILRPRDTDARKAQGNPPAIQ